MEKNDINNFNIGARIRKLRLKNGLSQEELALRSDITTTYLGLLERNMKNPTVKVIEQLCHALGISLGDFFSDGMPDGTPKDALPVDDITLQVTVQLANRTDSERKKLLLLIKELLRFRDLPQ